MKPSVSRVGFAEGWLRRGLASRKVGAKAPEFCSLSMAKSGVLGEGILMMYRLAVVTFIAFVVLGVSSVFYSHYIDVRDAEAVIMTRNVVDCVAPEGVVNLSVLLVVRIAFFLIVGLEMERSRGFMFGLM